MTKKNNFLKKLTYQSCDSKALLYYSTEQNKNSEKRKIKGGEFQNVAEDVTGILLVIFLEGYKACKRGDKRARAADIYSEQKLSVIVGKLREQNSRGNIAYKLAGKSREDESVYFEKRGEKLAYNHYSRHISRKNKEEHKGEKQSVIHV